MRPDYKVEVDSTFGELGLAELEVPFKAALQELLDLRPQRKLVLGPFDGVVEGTPPLSLKLLAFLALLPGDAYVHMGILGVLILWGLLLGASSQGIHQAATTALAHRIEARSKVSPQSKLVGVIVVFLPKNILL